MYHHFGDGHAADVDVNGNPVARPPRTLGQDFGPAPASPADVWGPLRSVVGAGGLFGLTWPQLLMGAAVMIAALWFFWPRPRRHRVPRARRP